MDWRIQRESLELLGNKQDILDSVVKFFTQKTNKLSNYSCETPYDCDNMANIYCYGEKKIYCELWYSQSHKEWKIKEFSNPYKVKTSLDLIKNILYLLFIQLKISDPTLQLASENTKLWFDDMKYYFCRYNELVENFYKFIKERNWEDYVTLTEEISGCQQDLYLSSCFKSIPLHYLKMEAHQILQGVSLEKIQTIRYFIKPDDKVVTHRLIERLIKEQNEIFKKAYAEQAAREQQLNQVIQTNIDEHSEQKKKLERIIEEKEAQFNREKEDLNSTLQNQIADHNQIVQQKDNDINRINQDLNRKNFEKDRLVEVMVVMRRVENNERPELNLEQLFSMLFSYAIVNDMIDDQYNLTINCKQNPNEGPSKMLMKCFLPKIKSVIIQNTFQNDEQLRVFLNEAFTKAAFENLEVNIGDEAQFGIEQYRPNIELAMPFIKNSLTLSGYSIALSDFQELVNKFNHGNELIFRNCNFTQVGTAPAFQNIDNPTLKTLTFIGCNITEQAHKDQITAAIAACNLNNIPTNVVYQ